MNILLTGATGNIGSSTLPALIERGHHVRALVPPGRTKMARTCRQHSQVELFVGDVRDSARMQQAVVNQDVIIHLAYVLPPDSNSRPEYARAVNLDGTCNLITAAQNQPMPPRFLFASSFDLYGNTCDQPYPRHVDDPVQVTDAYTAHKLQGEQWLRESGLVWSIFRFADVPLLGFRNPHPIMFDIPLTQRFEVLHTRDAATALANAMTCEAVWQRTLLIGGGPNCQITYGNFLFGLLDAMGIGALPTTAFGTQPYCTDWLDTSESQALLHYQHHSFADILHEIRALAGWRRQIMPIIKPVVRAAILRMSPYFNQRSASK